MVFALALAAYLVSSIPVAYLVARWTRGIDLRKFGSGNVGSSNVLAATSKRWVLPVAVFDLSKGILAVLAARWAGLDTGLQFIVGLAGIAGHNWPIYLNFRGGRGILTSLGVILAFSPLLGLIVLLMAFSLAPFRQLSLGVFAALLLLPVLSYYFAGFFGIDNRAAVTAGMVAITALAYARRLLAGPRSDLAADLSTGELLINRLVFDRDIRNRRLWLSRSENSGKAFS
ncbi:glycerol-3-phosphate acyltransferase PlsY [Dehalogenimonas formicexedens]|uniref:Glycerol-3-phosphate acyltransferase n=1 Tax=Dehalogenimonas formicexedens TaxID=1839801 RepID=A0A1P8FAK9_9CHLR|nr:glycerol-3-phosphate acyltransferase [Dehalogenimonas formicexedens]APV45497.1 glycerol-3-phosphate acyltransferase PlsY [Dehalogenimonas formicexedens]